MPDVTALRTGDPAQVAGYRIVRRLGQGGQGVVFLGVGEGGEQVAIKRLWLEDERSRRQFVKEVGAARRVAAFCTARVITFDLEGESPYVVSEFIEGPSLQQLVRESGPLSGSRLHRLAIGTVTALAAIHQAGVVHRDLKPANVMVSADGPRVIDFGIARDMSSETTITSRVFGTPAYMAPEQIRAERVSPQTDMFAWASVMAFAATGRAPFDAKHMMAVVHRITTMEPDLTGVPPALAEVLGPCLNKDATRRPTAQQTLAMLLGRPAPAHDAEDPTVVLAEGSRLARAATADPVSASRAGSETGSGAGSGADGNGQTVVTAQDVEVDPAGLGQPAVGKGPGAGGAVPIAQDGAGRPAMKAPGLAAVQPAGSARDGGDGGGRGVQVGPGRTAPGEGPAPVQDAGVGPDVAARAGDGRGAGAEPTGMGNPAGPVKTTAAWSGSISQDAETIPTPVPRPPTRSGPGRGSAGSGDSVSSESVTDGSVRPGSDRAGSGVAGSGLGSGEAGSGGPGLGRAGSDVAGSNGFGSGGARSGEAGSGEAGSGGPSGRESVGRPGAGGAIAGAGKNGPAEGALGSEPEFGTPEPLVPKPSDPSDPITLVRRKRMAGLESGVGAVLLVLLLGGSMVAGGAIALRALLHDDSPGAGSQSGQSGGSADPAPSGSSRPPTTSTTPAGAVLPDWTTGEWSGEVYQPTGQITSYKVQISLQAGKGQGRIEMPELGCAGALTVESTTKLTAILKTRLEDDAWGRCVGQSTLQLTRVGNDQLLYAWQDDAQAGNDAGGTVTRQ